ncbi:hypothetical protein [Phytohabitans rumicis]|uniref:hypothetical protein n=1 Tax=Phytohabitans rumicis TaxID=1076125 RepID=UPI001FE699C9|nr:hypothetical protein [Phytohabitans rumicis]
MNGTASSANGQEKVRAATRTRLRASRKARKPSSLLSPVTLCPPTCGSARSRTRVRTPAAYSR